jgi:putative RNA 2'-phosphotransferase
MKRLTSRYLAMILRHRPEELGLTLDSAGWVSVPVLKDACIDHGIAFDFDELDEIVRTNNKQRFEFSSDKGRIRARQGHSVEVELGYEPEKPPEVLYHGTAKSSLAAIRRDGLLKMQRHHVHLSADAETARNVGGRHGSAVVLLVRSEKMASEGVEFFRTENGVWLTSHVPPEFIMFGEMES